MPAKLLGTSPDEASCLRLIAEYYCGTAFRLEGESVVRVSDGKVMSGVRVVVKRGRYRFEEVS